MYICCDTVVLSHSLIRKTMVIHVRHELQAPSIGERKNVESEGHILRTKVNWSISALRPLLVLYLGEQLRQPLLVERFHDKTFNPGESGSLFIDEVAIPRAENNT